MGAGIATSILEMSKLSPIEFALCVCVLIPLFISSCIYSFVYPLRKYLLSPFPVPDADLGTEHQCRVSSTSPCPGRGAYQWDRQILYMDSKY